MEKFSHIPGVKQNDALSLECKRMKKNAGREVDINDIIGYPFVKRLTSTKVLHVEKEFIGYVHGQINPFDQN